MSENVLEIILDRVDLMNREQLIQLNWVLDMIERRPSVPIASQEPAQEEP